MKYAICTLVFSMLFGFQNCSDVGFQSSPGPNNSTPAGTASTETASSTNDRTPTHTPPNNGSSSNCVAATGNVCNKAGPVKRIPGCPDGRVCADFIGSYDGNANVSASGCDINAAIGAREYSFDGTNLYSRSRSPTTLPTKWALVGGDPNSVRCTPIYAHLANGLCNPVGTNRSVRVVPGKGCSYEDPTASPGVIPGTVQCDGSCK